MTGKSSPQSKDTRPSPAMKAEELAARLPPLLVEAERVALSVAQGVHGRRRAGAGGAFWQYRRALPGDGLASIDWRRSARSPHLFVRETEWAAAQTVWLWVDGGPSMQWRSRAGLPSKHGRASLLILALAALLLRGGERVAALAADLPPFWGKGALERLAGALERNPGAPPSPPRRPLRGASLVLAGDFLVPPGTIADRLEGLARQGASGQLLQVLDPAEEDLPYGGRVRFLAPQGGDWLEVPRAEDLRARYRDRLAAHREELASLARRLGFGFTTHCTAAAPAPALLALANRLGGG